MKKSVIVQWLGHACFKVYGDGYAYVLDPYEDHYVPGFGVVRETAEAVLCSHEHHDHGYREAVQIKPFDGQNPWSVRVIETWHDDQQGALRGSNKIHVLELGDLKVVHLGDLGCMLTAEQIAEIGKPDVLMIPVGGHYTIDAATAKVVADQLEARVIIPMHYRGEGFGYDVLTTVDTFTDLYDMVVYYEGDSIAVDDETEQQVAVLEQWNGCV